jgi:hypothetical protein
LTRARRQAAGQPREDPRGACHWPRSIANHACIQLNRRGRDHETVIRFCGQRSEAAGPFSRRHCSHSRMRNCRHLGSSWATRRIKRSQVPNPLSFFVLADRRIQMIRLRPLARSACQMDDMRLDPASVTSIAIQRKAFGPSSNTASLAKNRRSERNRVDRAFMTTRIGAVSLTLSRPRCRRNA